MKRRSLTTALIAAVITAACGGNDNPVTPTRTPVVPDCEKNHTAVLTITNNAANLLPRVVMIDGADYGLLAWQASRSWTLAASVPHNIEFRSGSNGAIVSLSRGLILTQCSTFALQNTYGVGDKVQ